MSLQSLTNVALVQRVLSTDTSTVTELELADRLDQALQEIDLLTTPAALPTANPMPGAWAIPRFSQQGGAAAVLRRTPAWAYVALVLAILLAWPDSPLVDKLEALEIIRSDSPFEHAQAEQPQEFGHGYP